MVKRKIKKVDVRIEKSIKIKDVKKVGLTKELLFSKKKIVVESDNLKTAYTLFCLQSLSSKYHLDYDWLLILIYLQELSLFGFTIMVLDRRIRLGGFLELDYIKENYSHKNKKLYSLTDKSFKIVGEFYKLLSDNSLFISKNRKAELDLDNKVKSVLGNYFDT